MELLENFGPTRDAHLAGTKVLYQPTEIHFPATMLFRVNDLGSISAPARVNSNDPAFRKIRALIHMCPSLHLLYHNSSLIRVHMHTRD